MLRSPLVLALAVLVAGCSTPPPSDGPPADVDVEMKDVEFAPVAFTARVGEEVVWKNTGALVHTVTADDGTFDSGNLSTGDSFSFTFDTPGTYTYHCEVHPNMTATITVE
jgi:plastocyanin